MDLHLSNKIVLVVGGAGKRGSIGEIIVRHFVSEGAIPVIIDRDSRGYAIQEHLQNSGIDALFIEADVTDPTACHTAVEAVISKYNRIDILINNVGLNDGTSLESSYQEFMDSIRLNLASYFLMTKLALPKLKESKGNIINIGSKVALTGQGGTSGYAAAKGGVLALTREWAVDLIGFEIRVNAVVISESETPAYQDWLDTFPDPEGVKEQIVSKIPLGKRMTTPEEIANAVLFLASDCSSHTTGQFVFVDGGYVHLDRKLVHDQVRVINGVVGK
ncbi:L-fucose dehydrogenase [Algoriphagus sp. 4150]|uniref:SDR family oxidoreductase n=1 Tax=Algoriphagus sp. 4150 TaxID=2817756 RepID=UPI0028581874|nr:SDR family oxidoreductase [Algoriphagus sp. 4150]MDR7131994.1 L-fucose dehydrogenase [Algoriphagus sp. 4150]